MTVHMKHDFSAEVRRSITVAMPLEKFAKQKCLLLELPRALIMRQKIPKLVAEDRSAARFQDDKW